jgi:hypothetical protein
MIYARIYGWFIEDPPREEFSATTDVRKAKTVLDELRT